MGVRRCSRRGGRRQLFSNKSRVGERPLMKGKSVCGHPVYLIVEVHAGAVRARPLADSKSAKASERRGAQATASIAKLNIRANDP